ncbi:MAG TPA: PEP-CTERM sorting domain-containing protein [Vicinamibacterales bacterium]|nr:PEP-CTERM sorting domain-containing protein [Vicinamibacterales bacterium]
MRKTIVALAVAALLTAGVASADPISVSVYGESSASITDLATGSKTIDFDLNWDASEPLLVKFDLKSGVDYQVNVALPSTSWTGMTVEVLNSAVGPDNEVDPAQPSYVPAGWSTSNKWDGYSFAQSSGLDRSFTVGAVSFAVMADETTHARDLLSFSGFGTGAAMLSFGLRTYNGSGAFLVRFAGIGDAMPTPEPASMLLLGAGLLGTATAIRRRRRSSES